MGNTQDQAGFAQEFLDEGAKTPILGPAYFDAGAVAARMIEKLGAELFEPLLKDFSKQFYSKLLDDTQVFLLNDVEVNIQGEIWRAVDATVRALLSGEKWAVERYALGDRYEAATIREAIAKHIPAELQDKRVADLVAERDRLIADNRMLRERSY